MRISSITKNAGKACNNRLYRHIRTFEKIVKNYFVILYKISIDTIIVTIKVIQQLNKATVYKGLQAIKRNKWFDRVEKVSDFPLYFYIVAGCAD